MLEQRLFAPAGDNAFEYFLALHERAPADAAASTALVQLQPYLVMGIERALAADAAGEARRLLGLLARADAHAAALPRLHGLLAEVDAREVAEAARTATPVAAAPVASAPAPARPVIAAPPTQIAPAPASPAAVPVTAPVAVTAAVTPAETRPLPASAAAAGPALPRLLVDVPPRYPLPALRKRIEGQVEVAFSVLPDGSVRDVRLVDAQPAGLFDASTLAVAQRWRFEATGREHHMQRVVSYRLPAGS
ncbi:MAG: energy transducer TonB [Pseudoxanthomonas sp.]|nr:energy transducer TonB [Pseudoxanthomonas sp.]